MNDWKGTSAFRLKGRRWVLGANEDKFMDMGSKKLKEVTPHSPDSLCGVI